MLFLKKTNVTFSESYSQKCHLGNRSFVKQTNWKDPKSKKEITKRGRKFKRKWSVHNREDSVTEEQDENEEKSIFKEKYVEHAAVAPQVQQANRQDIKHWSTSKDAR